MGRAGSVRRARPIVAYRRNRRSRPLCNRLHAIDRTRWRVALSLARPCVLRNGARRASRRPAASASRAPPSLGSAGASEGRRRLGTEGVQSCRLIVKPA